MKHLLTETGEKFHACHRGNQPVHECVFKMSSSSWWSNLWPIETKPRKEIHVRSRMIVALDMNATASSEGAQGPANKKNASQTKAKTKEKSQLKACTSVLGLILKSIRQGRTLQGCIRYRRAYGVRGRPARELRVRQHGLLSSEVKLLTPDSVIEAHSRDLAATNSSIESCKLDLNHDRVLRSSPHRPLLGGLRVPRHG